MNHMSLGGLGRARIPAAGGGGGSPSLSLSVTDTSANQDLTALGATDWAVWGSNSATPSQRKSGGGSLISLTTFGGGFYDAYSATGSPTISWTDGTPTGSGSNTSNTYNATNFAGTSTADIGLDVVFPAGTSTRTARVYFNYYGCDIEVQAIISDGSTSTQSDTTTMPAMGDGGDNQGLVQVSYAAASGSQTMTIRLIARATVFAYGSVGVIAAHVS